MIDVPCFNGYTFFNKKSASIADKSASGGGIKNKNMSNEDIYENIYVNI